jgi:hypothetical protein
MEVKGTAIMATREFVKSRFGEPGLAKWIAKLKPEAAEIYGGAILTNQWYDLKTILEEPCRAISEVFYNGDKKAYVDVGKHSADHGLKGIYKLFVKIGSPQFILSKAGSILPTYYKPSIMRGEEADKNTYRVFVNQFDQYSDVIEHRISGWIERALEICGCKGIRVNIIKSLAKKDPCTQYDIEWNL